MSSKERTCTRIKVRDVKISLEKVDRGEERCTLNAILVQVIRVST